MKKMILGFAMVVMVLGCVGCGKEEVKNVEEIVEITSDSKNEGFVPEQVTEEEPVITEEVAQDIKEVIDENNLEKYYDVTEFVGAPRLETVTIPRPIGKDKEKETLTVIYSKYVIIEPGNEWDVRNEYEIVKNDAIEVARSYYAILTDNNTPDDYSDDLLAYIFTTPIEK